MNKHSTKINKHTPSIFQGKLEFAAVSKPRMSLAVEYPAERIIMQAVLAALFILILGYLYFVAASVLNIMARKEAMTQSTQIEGAIGDLESQYFSLSQSITPQSGTSLGLAPITNTAYVNRPGNVGIANAAGDKEI